MNGENAEVHEDKVVIDEKIEPDADFKRNIEDLYWYKVRNERPYLDRPVAPVAAPSGACYDGTEETVRERESDWGDFLTDNMRNAYKGTDVALLNGGSIRIDDSICNSIRFEDLERTFAFDTKIVLVKLMGKDLREQLLESSVGSKRGDGRFLQVSGVSFRRVPVPNDSPTIKDIQVQTATGWTPLDENKPYVVAVSKYIFDCGDNYKFRQSVTEYVPAGPDLRAVTYTALSAQNKSKSSPALNRIIDLPEYSKPFVTLTPKWEVLGAAKRACP
jgi:2',3'-cyclic-nucleotide 2'-phosphodiesterase (5'-nucleotidase family)